MLRRLTFVFSLLVAASAARAEDVVLYVLAILNPDKPAAVELAFAILSPAGQEKLAQFGFHPVGLPGKPQSGD